ncbi:TetR/AcrR family transcriptional regulator [Nocardia sp. NPDC006630]|uniref:TetR/AcrR family transcriptional regulator n=1 Tax=Nocardia sp. NPDC006630 TaxID=3157181 RepID=UPI0033AB6BAF
MTAKNSKTADVRPAGPGRPADPALAERRRQQLVEAAYAIFAERGYHNTGITEITQQAGLGRGTFYLYFNTKRDILDGVIDFITEKIISAVAVDVGTEQLTSLGEFEVLMRRISGNLFALLDENPELSTVMIQNGMIDEAITSRMLALSDIFLAAIESYVIVGQENAVIDPGADSSSIALAVSGFAIAGLLRGLQRPFPLAERERYLDTGLELIRAFAVKPSAR